MIIGDFNFPNIDWDRNTAGDNKSRKFIECKDDRFLSQLVNFSTHEHGNILDIALTDDPSKVLNVDQLGNLGNSDHAIISIELSFVAVFNFTDELIYN